VNAHLFSNTTVGLPAELARDVSLLKSNGKILVATLVPTASLMHWIRSWQQPGFFKTEGSTQSISSWSATA